MNKSAIYKEYGIEYKAGKILAPEFGWINPLLINGNAKIGKTVYHFSTLPGKKEYKATWDGKEYRVYGTCADDCAGCYGMTGNYRYQSTIDSLAVKTVLARDNLEFVRAAIMAQIKADGIETIRIHATGDFFSRDYLGMWVDVIKENPAVTFWTYTKEYSAQAAFDSLDNANIVKSNVLDIGYNFGHCDYIIAVYKLLKDMGKPVYICKCGIDKNQHCAGCKGCSDNEYVLFLEHSTGYKAEKDSLYSELKAIVENQ